MIDSLSNQGKSDLTRSSLSSGSSRFLPSGTREVPRHRAAQSFQGLSKGKRQGAPSNSRGTFGGKPLTGSPFGFPVNCPQKGGPINLPWNLSPTNSWLTLVLPGTYQCTMESDLRVSLVDVGLGELKCRSLAEKWIWISTTKPQEANMFPNNNHELTWNLTKWSLYKENGPNQAPGAGTSGRM